MKSGPKKYIFIVVLFWTVSVGTSLSWNLFQYGQSVENDHVKRAQAFFQQVLITRGWSASHGGLYLRVTEKLPPNPFLHIPHRDIETIAGEQLTLINPALMTRMISELAKEKELTNFHLTSLKLINPGNAPLPWEKTALLEFEQGKTKEYYFTSQENGTDMFNYIASLSITKECLQCHTQQGYQEGDIRGGLAVSFPVGKKKTKTLILSHWFMLLFGVFLIIGFGNRIVRLTTILKRQSSIDGLTQIANRNHFDEILHREWLRSRRKQTPISLIFCDIDHFKLYNDTYGHQAGDECLKLVAQTLQNVLQRPADLVARYGGEEFVAVLPEISVKGVRVVAESLHAAVVDLQVAHSASDTADYVTISLGVATMTSQMLSERELIEHADKALYVSKKNGRNRVAYADELMRE